jgi:hypothetical protein
MEKLCGITFEATVEEGHPSSGLKNVMNSKSKIIIIPTNKGR